MTSPSTQHTSTAAVFAVSLVGAEDGVYHLVRDTDATAALTRGGRTNAVCGHDILPAPLGMPARQRCVVCPHAADVLGLCTP